MQDDARVERVERHDKVKTARVRGDAMPTAGAGCGGASWMSTNALRYSAHTSTTAPALAQVFERPADETRARNASHEKTGRDAKL